MDSSSSIATRKGAKTATPKPDTADEYAEEPEEVCEDRPRRGRPKDWGSQVDLPDEPPDYPEWDSLEEGEDYVPTAADVISPEEWKELEAHWAELGRKARGEGLDVHRPAVVPKGAGKNGGEALTVRTTPIMSPQDRDDVFAGLIRSTAVTPSTNGVHKKGTIKPRVRPPAPDTAVGERARPATDTTGRGRTWSCSPTGTAIPRRRRPSPDHRACPSWTTSPEGASSPVRPCSTSHRRGVRRPQSPATAWRRVC